MALKNKIAMIIIIFCAQNKLSAQLYFEGKLKGEVLYQNESKNITPFITYLKKDKSRFDIGSVDSTNKTYCIIINDYLKGERLVLTEKPFKTAVIYDLQLIDINEQLIEKTAEYKTIADYNCQKTILSYTLTKLNVQGQSVIHVNNNFVVNKPNGLSINSKYYNLPMSIESTGSETGPILSKTNSIEESNISDNLFNTSNYEGYSLIDVRPKQRASINENTKIDIVDNSKYGKYSTTELMALKKEAASKEDFDTAAEIKEEIEKRKLTESKNGKYSKLFLSELHQKINIAISNNDFILAIDLNNEILNRSK